MGLSLKGNSRVLPPCRKNVSTFRYVMPVWLQKHNSWTENMNYAYKCFMGRTALSARWKK